MILSMGLSDWSMSSKVNFEVDFHGECQQAQCMWPYKWASLLPQSSGSVLLPDYSVYAGTPSHVAGQRVRANAPGFIAENELKIDILKRQHICLAQVSRLLWPVVASCDQVESRKWFQTVPKHLHLLIHIMPLNLLSDLACAQCLILWRRSGNLLSGTATFSNGPMVILSDVSVLPRVKS